jgi:hypothetical protein
MPDTAHPAVGLVRHPSAALASEVMGSFRERESRKGDEGFLASPRAMGMGPGCEAQLCAYNPLLPPKPSSLSLSDTTLLCLSCGHLGISSSHLQLVAYPKEKHHLTCGLETTLSW